MKTRASDREEVNVKLENNTRMMHKQRLHGNAELIVTPNAKVDVPKETPERVEMCEYHTKTMQNN